MGKTGLGAIVCKTAHVRFHGQKRVHTRLSEKDRTHALTRRNTGRFGWGWYHYPRIVSHVSETLRGQGGRTANFAAFGAWSWVLPKNAESLRNSDAHKRVAVPRRRGPAGLRSSSVHLQNRQDPLQSLLYYGNAIFSKTGGVDVGQMTFSDRAREYLYEMESILIPDGNFDFE